MAPEVSRSAVREQESAEGWCEAAISGRRFQGTVSSGLGSQAFLTLYFITDLCTQSALMRLQSGVLPARQGIKMHWKNLSGHTNRREKFTSPISSELNTHETADECHLQEQKSEAMERQARLLDCTGFTVCP